MRILSIMLVLSCMVFLCACGSFSHMTRSSAPDDTTTTETKKNSIPSNEELESDEANTFTAPNSTDEEPSSECFGSTVPSEEVSYPPIIATLRDRITTTVELCEPVLVERKLLKSDEGCIVYVPCIEGEKYNSVNETIMDFFVDLISGYTTAENWDSDAYLRIEYDITYNRNGIISLCFFHESYLSMRPHERIYGFNFDLKSGSSISRKDLFVIDESFLHDLLSYRGDEYGREEFITEYLLGTYGTEGLIEMINKEELMYFFFSQEYVYISFPLTQSLTYHLEYGIPWQRTVAVN